MSHFRFFDLPREIRDEIYRHLKIPTKEIQHGVDEADTGTYTFDAPLLPILLSNRQLNSEYRDLLPKRRKLLLEGAKCDYWTGYHPVPQSLANAIASITVYMHIVCYCDNLDEEEYADQQVNYPCDAAIQCHGYAYDLESYLNHYPNVETVSVSMCMFRRADSPNERLSRGEPPQLSHTAGFPQNLKRLVALPGIKDLEIMGFSGSAYESFAYEDYLKGRKNSELGRIARWSTAEGWKS